MLTAADAAAVLLPGFLRCLVLGALGKAVCLFIRWLRAADQSGTQLPPLGVWWSLLQYADASQVPLLSNSLGVQVIDP